MVVDSSAVIAILVSEPEAHDFTDAIERDVTRLFSAVSFFETSIVIETRRGAEGLARLDLFVAEAELDIIPFTLHDARAARRAYHAFGKGRHAAGLNFGDCVSYALSNETGEPLLFKGNDFGQTDVLRAI